MPSTLQIKVILTDTDLYSKLEQYKTAHYLVSLQKFTLSDQGTAHESTTSTSTVTPAENATSAIVSTPQDAQNISTSLNTSEPTTPINDSTTYDTDLNRIVFDVDKETLTLTYIFFGVVCLGFIIVLIYLIMMRLVQRKVICCSILRFKKKQTKQNNVQ